MYRASAFLYVSQPCPPAERQDCPRLSKIHCSSRNTLFSRVLFFPKPFPYVSIQHREANYKKGDADIKNSGAPHSMSTRELCTQRCVHRFYIAEWCLLWRRVGVRLSFISCRIEFEWRNWIFHPRCALVYARKRALFPRFLCCERANVILTSVMANEMAKERVPSLLGRWYSRETRSRSHGRWPDRLSDDVTEPKSERMSEPEKTCLDITSIKFDCLWRSAVRRPTFLPSP